MIGANVGVLHDVFGFDVAVQNGPGDAVEALVVAAHDDLVERSFSRPDAVDHLFVCQALRLSIFRIFPWLLLPIESLAEEKGYTIGAIYRFPVGRGLYLSFWCNRYAGPALFWVRA